ncbi:MAG: T9SS type A sorting domain-containing protein [Bacteroidetes bacterium]|nr:T9SS type A sorting domain-containing protein [Bacteroidota bacterium]
MKQKTRLSAISVSLLCGVNSFSQYALQIYGAFVSLSGGTGGTPIYVIVNEGASTGIYRDATLKGHIISEGQYNYVKWNMQNAATTYIYPFGGDDNNAHYIPFTFDKTSVGACEMSLSTKGAFGASPVIADNTPYFSPITTSSQMGGTQGGDASNAVIDRWWQITVNAGTPTADLTFSYLGQENTTGNNGPFAPQRWGTAWEIPLNSGTAGGTTTDQLYTSSGTGVTSFSPWVLSTRVTPLPVELLSFSAKCNNGRINFNWSTATETNNDHFTIERSVNGIDYKAIQQVKGAGNSSGLRKYKSAVTVSEPNGYYRLKQTDFDGKYTFSKIIVVNCDGDGAAPKSEFVIFPNPSDGDNVFMKMNGLNAEEKVLVILVDVLGQVVFEKVSVTNGNGEILESIAGAEKLAAGIYTIVGSVRNDIYKQKLIVH